MRDYLMNPVPEYFFIYLRQFYAALRPYRNPHLGPSSVELYRQTYEALSYREKEW